MDGVSNASRPLEYVFFSFLCSPRKSSLLMKTYKVQASSHLNKIAIYEHIARYHSDYIFKNLSLLCHPSSNDYTSIFQVKIWPQKNQGRGPMLKMRIMLYLEILSTVYIPVVLIRDRMVSRFKLCPVENNTGIITGK